MVNPIPESVRKLWDEWNIRGVILLSLCLQILLTVFAPLRKRARNNLAIMLLWSVYLLADLTAVFALGLISNSKEEASDLPTSTLLALWPPFLILHLGGPDNITAFALEDNELWLRHFVGFFVQAVAAVYIFLLSIPGTKLLVPTILMFVAATVKYLERSRAFYLASFDGFQKLISSVPKFEERLTGLRRHVMMIRAAYLFREADNGMIEKKDDEKAEERDWPEHTTETLKALLDANKYWRIFRGLIVNLIFSFNQHRESRNYFRKLNPEEAYGIIEIELNFIYEVLYTKVLVVFSRAGCVGRFISFGSVVAALSIFHIKVNNHNFGQFDVAITYILFLTAIALDVVAMITLVSFDLTLATLADYNNSKSVYKMIHWILNLKKSEWHELDSHVEVLGRPFLFGRWSGYIPAYNLISYCINRRPTRVYRAGNCLSRCTEKITQMLSTVLIKVSNRAHIHKFLQLLGSINEIVISFLGLDEFLNGIRYVSHEPLAKDVWDLIFNELKEKSHAATGPEAATKITTYRGESILKERDYCSDLLPFVSKLTYDESILVWHIATEIHYQYGNDNKIRNSKISKVLSDYMVYLLILQPSNLSAVRGIAKTRFEHTCVQVREAVEEKKLKSEPEETVCYGIFLLRGEEYEFDEHMSVLYNAWRLVHRLNSLHSEQGPEEKWRIISKVWVEMLSYAAVSSGSRGHAQHVNRGGELITFVWFLMTHFGLQQQFQNVTEDESVL